ncbi:MAG: hypothetical protein LBQ73_10070, partial [Tannerellaceae bacterium]|nr:hypothetical protein [Tannerellaceae bacterium]
MIAVRRKVAVRPKASGRQLRLFDDDVELGGYRYTCYVTTLKLSAADVWRLYRGRANCEIRIPAWVRNKFAPTAGELACRVIAK